MSPMQDVFRRASQRLREGSQELPFRRHRPRVGGMKFWGFRGGWTLFSGARYYSDMRTTTLRYWQAPRETAFSNIEFSSTSFKPDSFWLRAEIATHSIFLNLSLGISGGRRGWGHSLNLSFFVEKGKPSFSINILDFLRVEWMSFFRRFIFRL